VNEIADRLNAPEGTVKSWLFRARTLLRKDLAPMFA
jgi:RNA polymerase sigma-70 factor (ECF subfamily)